MLRTLFALLLLITLPFTPAHAQRPSQPQQLQLTAKILGQRFCAGRGGVDFLHLKLRLRYRNAGAQKLILYRGNNLFYQVWVGSAQSSYQLMTTGSRYLQMGTESIQSHSPGREFVILSSDEIFETELTVSLPVAREGAQAPAGAITHGEHLLKLTVSTWYESRQLGERLRERWRRTGLLWTIPVTTAPVEFSTGSYTTQGC